MEIFRVLAGYSLGRADVVRRAMSKKKFDVLEGERANFVYGNEKENIPGSAANGVPADVANHIFDEMLDFANYAFNKAHAVCYAVLAYQTAYLKYHYPQGIYLYHLQFPCPRPVLCESCLVLSSPFG